MKQLNGPLLVSIDPFSTDAQNLDLAFATATQSATSMRLSLSATSVISPDQVNWPADFQKTWKSEFQSLGDKALRRKVKKLAPHSQIPVHALLQPWNSIRESTKSLTRYAMAKKAAAIVVFTNHKKKAAFSFPGSFISTLVSTARTPVLAINAKTESPTQVKTMLFATDFSNEDTRSFVTALRWAKQMGAKLIVFHAITLPVQSELAASAGLVGGWMNLERYRQEQEDWVKRKGKAWVNKALKSGVEAQFVLENTSYSPSVSVLKTAERRKIDLIITTVKTGPTAAFFLGSVTREILARSVKPVLVLPTKRGRPEQSRLKGSIIKYIEPLRDTTSVY